MTTAALTLSWAPRWVPGLDSDGTARIDLHLNGGVFNLGHRNPEIIARLLEASESYDIGITTSPAVRALLAQEARRRDAGNEVCGLRCRRRSCGNSAIKSARRTTGRRTIICLPMPTTAVLPGAGGGDDKAAKAFLSDDPETVIPRSLPSASRFGSCSCPRRGRGDGRLQTIPAGFPVPSPDYLPEVRRLCDVHGAAYIADEVQTGLGRTGSLWGPNTSASCRTSSSRVRDCQGASTRSRRRCCRGIDGILAAGRRLGHIYLWWRRARVLCRGQGARYHDGSGNGFQDRSGSPTLVDRIGRPCRAVSDLDRGGAPDRRGDRPADARGHGRGNAR